MEKYSQREVVYLAGPYRANTISGVLRHIKYAESVAMTLWEAGYIVICPHKNTAFFDGIVPDEVWLEAGKELIRRADMVGVLLGWQDSEGAREEVAYAKKINKPALTIMELMKRKEAGR